MPLDNDASNIALPEATGGYQPSLPSTARLELFVAPGSALDQAGELQSWLGDRLPLTAQAFNVIYLDPQNAMQPTVGQDTFPTGAVPIATVLTDGESIIDARDLRAVPVATPAGSGFGTVTHTAGSLDSDFVVIGNGGGDITIQENLLWFGPGIGTYPSVIFVGDDGGAFAIEGDLLDRTNATGLAGQVPISNGGSGGGWQWGDMTAGGITLQTDGTPNGSQILLNLKSGTNITLTDNGVGGVTIDAANGGGTTPGGASGTLQYNNSGGFGGVLRSAVSGDGFSLIDGTGNGTTYGPGGITGLDGSGNISNVGFAGFSFVNTNTGAQAAFAVTTGMAVSMSNATAVALKLTGDASQSHILDLFTNGVNTNCVFVTYAGGMSITPDVGAAITAICTTGGTVISAEADLTAGGGPPPVGITASASLVDSAGSGTLIQGVVSIVAVTGNNAAGDVLYGGYFTAQDNSDPGGGATETSGIAAQADPRAGTVLACGVHILSQTGIPCLANVGLQIDSLPASTDWAIRTNTGLCEFGDGVKIHGNVGFFNHTPAAKPTVSGSRSANAALASLLTSLAGLGLLTDSSS